jgi:hypothetical protein
VTALVRGYLRAVDPDSGAVIHCPEVKQQTLCTGGRRIFEGPSVPDQIVERPLAYPRKLSLVAERDGNAPIERGIPGTKKVSRRFLPTLPQTRIAVIEGKGPRSVQVDPIRTA